MINCLIVDDEPLAREILRLHVSRLHGWNTVAECKSASEALEVLIHNSIQVIFLDIQMPKILGTDFLRSIKDPPMIIFTTAYSNYAVEGFELNAIDYLLKPITFERFSLAAAKVQSTLKNPVHPANHEQNKPATQQVDDYIFIRQDNKQVKVMLDDILFLEARRDFTMIQLKDKKMLAGFHLKILEGMLPLSEFMRVHRSYIVRLKAIDAVSGNTLEVRGFQIQVSAANKDELFAALKL